MSASLTPWVAGRADLFTALPPDVARFDPRRAADAQFFARLYDLDRVAWCEPLGRVRPSWVFYDCALIPGALFGFARATPSGPVPESALALIPTVDGRDLVQSLAAPDEELALRTLTEGARALGAGTLIVALPWASPFVARFLAFGHLALQTAWTPAHDEPRTVTFTVPSRLVDPRTTATPFALGDDDALRSLQAELERGAPIDVRGATPERVFLSPRSAPRPAR